MRPRVNDNLFDGSQHQGSQPSGSTSHSCLSQVSTSRDNKSLNDEAAPEAPEAQEKPVIYAPLESYPRGSFDTSLLLLHADHIVKHVWEGDVYLFTFPLHMFYID